MMKKGWYIFLYHDISWEENPYIRGIGGTCPPDIFRDHLMHLSKIGEIVSISEGLKRLNSKDIRNPIFSFWFDDGLAGVRRYALPLLEKYNVTAALSISSRFWNREELFWRFKLSYLSYVDGLRFLRPRLRKYGYEKGMSIKDFSLDNFSESIVEEIDVVFRKFISEIEREDAFRLFETAGGLLKLQEKNWILANHTAAHYPVGEDNFINNFKKQFIECEDKYKELFGKGSKFWVLPFGRPGYYSKRLMETFQQCGDDRYLALVSDKMNNYSNIKERIIFRIDIPIYTGKDLIKFIRQEI